MEELMALEEVTHSTAQNSSRAIDRLDMAVALIEHLRNRDGKLSDNEDRR